MRKLILNKGEKICPKCNGSSYSNENETKNCMICKNYGKLDWLSNITSRPGFRIRSIVLIFPSKRNHHFFKNRKNKKASARQQSKFIKWAKWRAKNWEKRDQVWFPL